jgi:hypothetical protein
MDPKTNGYSSRSMTKGPPSAAITTIDEISKEVLQECHALH